VKIDNGEISIDEGRHGDAGLTVHADAVSWIRFLNGDLSLPYMLLSRKLTMRGNPFFLKKFKDCLLI
jgi:putative sterol carrier protein